MERHRDRGCLTGTENAPQFSEESEFFQVRDFGRFQSPIGHAGLELCGLREVSDFGRDVFRDDESVILVGSEKVRLADEKEVNQDTSVADNEKATIGSPFHERSFGEDRRYGFSLGSFLQHRPFDHVPFHTGLRSEFNHFLARDKASPIRLESE